MHNWWIAALEHFGLITREEAKHISDEIRLSIHKDRYEETYQELELILGKLDLRKSRILSDLESKIDTLESKLDSKPEKTIASKK